ncbi:SDR family oxidoreductase [Phyllobacterium myrsinacearum]|uniref:NAD(P)-dependent dehydrogenase (Short-subunit alcohol dehydrogenase family) n=1 Tax=Phyllobacterium myrsinacearum TaxID=28101 RepID=A0A839EH89_9HYPH|nr:SDR family oxidoreductase [Phyllobacterium myrsinacearum]MBA8877655.1 NAD(P)-dependent dehydrogenase (short-subunit alcohol dehydrogenase family) [Phyllobacterium myrsinacearum]
MGRFTGKRILITGGTSGIGLAGAKRIAAEGGEVIITGFSQQHLDETRQALPVSLVFRNDAGDPATAKELAEKVAQAGKLDGIWLNAGYAAIGTIDEMDASFFDRMMNANVRGPILQMAALSSHLNPGASVLLTGSTAAYERLAFASVYSATKGAMLSLARSWAAALGERQIRVNVLVPGPIETNLRNFLAEDIRRQFEAAIVGQLPLARIGTPEEAAAVGLFLLSDDASFVTGSQYAVDGGMIMH